MAAGQKTVSRWLLVAIAAVLVAAPLASPPRAAAGEFTINACQADAGNFASTAFENFATRGMRWRRACNPLGPRRAGKRHGISSMKFATPLAHAWHPGEVDMTRHFPCRYLSPTS